MIELKDVAWLAGLLEGEGSFSTMTVKHRLRTKRRITVSVMMTDEDVLRRAAGFMRAKLYGPYGPYRGCRKRCWQINLSGKQAAAWMMTLYSFMGSRRRLEIENALASWKTFRT